ncbi:MAG: hypothetical protein JW715_01780 [Sedimentisphaerales bacterium]|nr:hypothetical protein [Sedimentisphaerales bacterium]
MKKAVFSIILVLPVLTATLFAAPTSNFDDYFADLTMRVDFFMTGDANEQEITLDAVYKQGRWAGNPRKTIDDLNLGGYYAKVYDVATNRLIFSRGFNCIFFEYRTTAPAKQGVKKTYHESALIPYPHRPILFVIESRDKLNLLHPIFIRKINPKDSGIIHPESDPNDRIFDIMINGDCHDKVDFLFLAEGYTAGDVEKFHSDAERFTNILFEMEPFKSYKSKFNVRAAMRPSAESGADEPTRNIFRDTVMDASANALDTPRYMLINNNKAMQDIAASAPYDAILIATNISRYSNGGIYNRYCIFAADNRRSVGICPHEFGHSFAGLADEYFGSDDALSEFYPKGVEPLEPNITALLDPESPKWKHLIEPGTPIPTAPDPNNPDQIGVFEGAGYTAKGLYRPKDRCIMRSGREFCEVCREGIIRVINHLSNE